MIDYSVNNQILRIGRDEYLLSHIKDIYVIKLNFLQQFIRQLLLGVQFSLVGWVSSLWLGEAAVLVALILFCCGVIYGISSFRLFELRAKFYETDESGDQTVPILHANNDEQLDAILNIYMSIKKRLTVRK